MGNVRAGYTGKYELSKHGFYQVYHYCLQYNEWKEEYNTMLVSSRSAQADKEPTKESIHSDPTYRKAEKMAKLGQKMDLIEQTASEVDPFIAKYILYAVTNEGVTYNQLREKHRIPCGKNYFYERRRRFYWLISKRME